MTADTVSREKRSETMSSVRSADTKPEWILRCGLHRMGFRYRLRDKRLPGKPDLVFPKFLTVVFVHGCFWHRHKECRRATFPKSNREFWAAKFERNVERDARTRAELEKAGWRVLVVWECELEDDTEATLARTARALRSRDHSAGVPPCDGQTDNLSVGTSENAAGSAAPPDRKELLEIASEKVRFRVASYKASKVPTEE